MEATLETVFIKYASYQFIFVQPGGNHGDHLIYLGAESLADRLGISYRTVTCEDFNPTSLPPKQVIYIHGSGGFNTWCSGRAPRLFIETVNRYDGVVVQGPCTFEDSDSYARRVFSNISDSSKAISTYLFARELTTYELIEKHAPQFIITASDHDTAFRYGGGDMADATTRDGGGDYCLFAFREDQEAPDDVSRLGLKGPALDPARFARSFEEWYRIHEAARAVVSNRLHSAIAAVTAGVPTVIIMPGAYHKNRSVYEFSLAERGVAWHEYGEELPVSGSIPFSPLLPDALTDTNLWRSICGFIYGLPVD